MELEIILFLSKIEPLTISLIAIGISIISVVFVIIDKLRLWTDNHRMRKLKKDKAILFPIINLDIKNFSSIRREEKGNTQKIIHKADYANLFFLFQSIETKNLINRDIANTIEKVKSLRDEDLFKLKRSPDIDDLSHQFSDIVIKLIYDSRSYLAIVL